MRSRKLFLFAVAGLVSAAFAYLGTGLHPIWWALWLAPIPVLAISARPGFPARCDHMADRRNQSMELCQARDRTATANHRSLLYSSGRGFRFGRSVCAQFSSARIAVPRLTCFSRLLGGVRISDRDRVAS